MNEHIASLRKDYSLKSLSESEVDKDPFKQFNKWFKESMDAGVDEPHAMNISTVSEYGTPSSRIVLLREFSEEGIVFYNNYNSKKSSDLRTNSKIAIHFFWQELQRQVRIEGTAMLQTKEKNDTYFLSRPVESQISAWASSQSDTIVSRDELENEVKKYEEIFETKPLVRPDFWGGWVIKPNYFEFWQGRQSRLHDRICYKNVNENIWEIFRLAP